MAFREGRLRRTREAKATLEAEAMAEAEQAKTEGRIIPGVPEDQAQRNLADPDSHIIGGPKRRDFQQSYSRQAAADSECQVIVAARATNQPPDKGQSISMEGEAIENTGAVPKELSADAGYYSAKAVEELCSLGTAPFIARERTRHGTSPQPAHPGRIPKGLSARERMRRRSVRGRYALRMKTMETVFGQMKQGWGFRQFLLRGLEKVNREWLLICTHHNLLKLFRFGAWRPGKAQGNAPTGNIKESRRTVDSPTFERLSGRLRLHPAGMVAAA